MENVIIIEHIKQHINMIQSGTIKHADINLLECHTAAADSYMVHFNCKKRFPCFALPGGPLHQKIVTNYDTPHNSIITNTHTHTNA